VLFGRPNDRESIHDIVGHELGARTAEPVAAAIVVACPIPAVARRRPGSWSLGQRSTSSPAKNDGAPKPPCAQRPTPRCAPGS
jgi:hypothetical protein